MTAYTRKSPWTGSLWTFLITWINFNLSTAVSLRFTFDTSFYPIHHNIWNCFSNLVFIWNHGGKRGPVGQRANIKIWNDFSLNANIFCVYIFLNIYDDSCSSKIYRTHCRNRNIFVGLHDANLINEDLRLINLKIHIKWLSTKNHFRANKCIWDFHLGRRRHLLPKILEKLIEVIERSVDPVALWCYMVTKACVSICVVNYIVMPVI